MSAPLMISVAGVRGIVGHSLTPAIVTRFSAAFARSMGPGVIVVGRDRYGLVRETERVRFLRSERDLNAGEARNRGIEAAGGEVIFFLDADCIPAEDWMARQRALWEKRLDQLDTYLITFKET